MMRKYSIGLILLYLFYFCRERKAEIPKDANIRVKEIESKTKPLQVSLGKELKEVQSLIDTYSEWGPTGRGHGWYFEFEKPNKVFYRFHGEGCGEYKGSVTVEGRKLKFSLKDNTENCDQVDKDDEREYRCGIYEVKNDIYSKYALKCDKLDYITLCLKCNLEPGTKRESNNNQFVKIKEKNAILLSNMKMRKGPGQNFPVSKCEFNENGASSAPRAVLEKGRHTAIIGRTPEKKKVGQWENYWYYVDIGATWYDSCDQTQIWLFGQWLEIK